MNKQDIIDALNSLSQDRPVFHSEADFQHELAIRLRNMGYDCRLEKPYTITLNGSEIKVELDILVIEDDGNKTAIELKYVKKRYEGIHNNEHFDLAQSWHTNLSRFDFFSDYQRVSKLVNAGTTTKGFAIFLTNHEDAWDIDVTGTDNLGRQFSIHEGRHLEDGSILNWINNPGPNSVTSKRLPPYCPIQINQHVELNWDEYSNQPTLFRYLLLEVDPPQAQLNL